MGRIVPTGTLQVRTVALDDLVSHGKLPVPDYIKMDVEGTEMLAPRNQSAFEIKNRT